MTAPTPADALSLPSWIYQDPEFFALEKQTIFRQAWQLVCHTSDIPNTGDYHSFEFMGESVIVLRGEDGQIRSFHNACRHRASRLLDDPKGHCGRRITCPYHAWTYGLDGRLVAIPQREAFKGLDFGRHGLVPVEQEIFLGFIFVRFEPGLPSVKEMAAPYADELAAYRMEELVPQGRVTFRPRNVNWKNVADNYSDGLHITVAHPGLTRLFGRGYGIEAKPWIDKMWGALRDVPSSNWSERLYQSPCRGWNTCQTIGFVGALNFGSDGRQLPTTVHWVGTKHTVTLTHGQSAHWRFSFVQPSILNCAPEAATNMILTPPNNTSPVLAGRGEKSCNGVFNASPLEFGV